MTNETHEKQLQICKKVIQVTISKMLDSFMKKIDYDMAMNDDEDLLSPEC